MADTTQNLVKDLNAALADVLAFYFRAHAAHWNVLGPNFNEYHDLFGSIASDVYGSVDDLAENIRKLGAVAPSSLNEIVAKTMISDGPVGRDPRALCNDLIENNKLVIDILVDVFECANALNQQGIANFVAGRIDMHQKWAWQLSSSIGIDIMDPSVDPLVNGVDPEDRKERSPRGVAATGWKNTYAKTVIS